MHPMASNLGSVLHTLLSTIGAGMPTWYDTVLNRYCYDVTLLGYLAIAFALFSMAFCLRLLHKHHKVTTYYELFPRTGGDVCKLCAALSLTMSHYDKTGRRS